MSEAVRPELLVARLASESEPWRVDAELKLIGLGSLAVPLLVGALHHASPAVRLHAVHALGVIRDPRGLGAVVAALADQENNGAVAIAAEKALVAWGNDAADAVLDVAQRGPGHARPRAVRTLGKVGGPAQASALTALLSDPDATVRAQAGVALLTLSGQAAVGEVAALLSDTDKWTRYEVAEALVHAGSPLGEAVLESAKADPEEKGSHVSFWAEDLLEEIAELKRSGGNGTR